MELLERIIAQDPDHAPTLKERPSSVVQRQLPFWRKTTVVEVTVELPHRALVLTYTDDGKSILPLADEKDLGRVNFAEGIILAAGQLAEYLALYLRHAKGQRLVQRSEDIPWLGASDGRAQAETHLVPLTAERKVSSFTVKACVLAGQQLSLRTFEVGVNGSVKELSSTVVAEGLPVAVAF